MSAEPHYPPLTAVPNKERMGVLLAARRLARRVADKPLAYARTLWQRTPSWLRRLASRRRRH